MWRMFVVSVLLVACSKGSELTQKKLPGFTIALPKGVLVESPANTYLAGSARMKLGEDDAILLSWNGTESNTLDLDPDKLAAYLHGRTKVDIAPFGMEAMSARASYPGRNIYTTITQCDRRLYLITTSLPDDKARSLHTAMVKSVRCEPEPGALARPPIEIVDLLVPSTFARFDDHRRDYPTVTYVRDDEAVTIAVQAIPRVRMSDLDVKTEIEGVFVNLEDLVVNEPVDDVVRFSGLDGDTHIFGAAMSKRCSDLEADALLFVQALSPESAAEALASTRMTCLARPREST